MNRGQRIVGIVGVALVLLCGLFPPYEGEYRREGDNLTKYMGYRFLFTPPSEKEVYRAIIGIPPSITTRQGQLSQFSSQIITQRIWVQVITIVIATLGVLFVIGGKRKEPSSNKPDGANSL